MDTENCFFFLLDTKTNGLVTMGITAVVFLFHSRQLVGSFIGFNNKKYQFEALTRESVSLRRCNF